eukprot:scaffold121285_cov31-Tisochrysis_lutea.AAC.3
MRSHPFVNLPQLPPIEDALIGALVGPNASVTLHKPSAIRFRNTGEYALSVCEHLGRVYMPAVRDAFALWRVDTTFILLHKLSVQELESCRTAIEHRRSARCPRGPCDCQSLGVKSALRKRVVRFPDGDG